jgi:hypothetical protein
LLFKILVTIFTLASAVAVGGCNPGKRFIPQEASRIGIGTTKEECRRILDHRWSHQFSVVAPDGSYECYWFEHLLVFRNNVLLSIVEFPLKKTVPNPTKNWQWAEAGMAEVLDSESVPPDDYVAFLTRPDKGEGGALWAAHAMSVCLESLLTFPDMLKRASWERRFNSERMSVGMTAEGVEDLLGQAKITESRQDGTRLSFFGPGLHTDAAEPAGQLMRLDIRYWVAAVTRHDEVIAVLSDEFLPRYVQTTVGESQ